MTKDEIRGRMKALRRALSADEIEDKSDSITRYVLSLDCFKQARTVMVYLSAFKEPSVRKIIDDLFISGKTVVVPISNMDDFTITPSLLKSRDKLRCGAYGIMEPEECIPVKAADIDLALIPGIAFDRRGMRAGFGKGYYDRFLAEFAGTKIGICYDFQLCENIPTDAHDIGMDIIITEKEIYDDF